MLLYASGIDPFFEDLVKDANRVFYFQEGPRDAPKMQAKAFLEMKNELHPC